MKLTINKKESNALWGALQFYVLETTHSYPDGEARPGLPDGDEKELLKSIMDKLLKNTRKDLKSELPVTICPLKKSSEVKNG